MIQAMVSIISQAEHSEKPCISVLENYWIFVLLPKFRSHLWWILCRDDGSYRRGQQPTGFDDCCSSSCYGRGLQVIGKTVAF